MSDENFTVDWRNTFLRDPDVLSNILAGVTRSSARAGRSKRGSLDRKLGSRQYEALTVGEFSENDFRRAVEILCGPSSEEFSDERQEALDVDLDDPSEEEIEQVAAHFGRHPSYFLEYRVKYLQASLEDYLKLNPGVSSSWFVKAFRQRGVYR